MVPGKSTTPSFWTTNKVNCGLLLRFSVWHRLRLLWCFLFLNIKVLRQEKGFAGRYWCSDQSAVWALWSTEEGYLFLQCWQFATCEGLGDILWPWMVMLCFSICFHPQLLRHHWLAAIRWSGPHSDRMPWWPVWRDDLPASVLDDELSRTAGGTRTRPLNTKTIWRCFRTHHAHPCPSMPIHAHPCPSMPNRIHVVHNWHLRESTFKLPC